MPSKRSDKVRAQNVILFQSRENVHREDDPRQRGKGRRAVCLKMHALTACSLLKTLGGRPSSQISAAILTGVPAPQGRPVPLPAQRP